MPYDIVDHIQVLQKLLEAQTPLVEVTLVDIRGSAPQVVGAKAIVTSEGLVGGTIGGGKVEAAAIQYAQQLLTTAPGKPELQTWNLQTEIGMTCGGEVKLFFEPRATRSWPIAIFGAGHVAQTLVRVLLPLDCHLTCVDSRPEWLAKLPSNLKLTPVCAAEPQSLVSSQPPETFFVLLSKGHATDLPVLAEILQTRKAPYVGVIGSKQKASVLRRDLKSQGIDDARLDSFFCPMGLPIGRNTTHEIALSIAAQLLQVRDQIHAQ